MARPKKGEEKAPGERARIRTSVDRAKRGLNPAGRRGKVEDPEAVEIALRMAGLGMTPPAVSRVLGLSSRTVNDWLEKGEVWIEETGEAGDNPYAVFYTRWHQVLEGSKERALERMLNAKDERMVERWLTRVDREGEYTDWEKIRIAEASKTNVQILNTPANMAEAMTGVRERLKVEGKVGPARVDTAEYRQLAEGEG